MKKTVTLSVLKSMLANGNVQFTYKKKNGETREAVGTTNKEALDRVGVEFSGDGQCSSVRYYDVNKNAWRSLSSECNVTVTAEAI